jgi:hypothetical protein
VAALIKHHKEGCVDGVLKTIQEDGPVHVVDNSGTIDEGVNQLAAYARTRL